MVEVAEIICSSTTIGAVVGAIGGLYYCSQNESKIDKSETSNPVLYVLAGNANLFRSALCIATGALVGSTIVVTGPLYYLYRSYWPATPAVTVGADDKDSSSAVIPSE